MVKKLSDRDIVSKAADNEITGEECRKFSLWAIKQAEKLVQFTEEEQQTLKLCKKGVPTSEMWEAARKALQAQVGKGILTQEDYIASTRADFLVALCHRAPTQFDDMRTFPVFLLACGLSRLQQLTTGVRSVADFGYPYRVPLYSQPVFKAAARWLRKNTCLKSCDVVEETT